MDEEIKKQNIYEEDTLNKVENLIHDFQIDFKKDLERYPEFLKFCQKELKRSQLYINEQVETFPFINNIKKYLVNNDLFKDLFLSNKLLNKPIYVENVNNLVDFMNTENKKIEGQKEYDIFKRIEYFGDEDKIHQIIEKLKEYNINPNLEECSRSYCKKFLREKAFSYERNCRNENECICMKLACNFPDTSETSLNKTESFICREFLLPSEEVKARRGILPEELGLCLLCIRFKTTMNVWNHNREKKDANFLLQNHYNTIGSDDGYSIIKCEWVLISIFFFNVLIYKKNN